jgi:hypothetical protein
MSDQAFSAMDTLDYYQRMAKANGGMDKVQTWSRMFLVPGMYHCRGGEFALDNFDVLSAAIPRCSCSILNWRARRMRSAVERQPANQSGGNSIGL